MTKQVEFFFDIVSPASYLAWTQMPELAERTGAKIIYRPFFLPGLFKIAGSSSPIEVPAKGKWLLSDLTLWAAHYDVPFKLNSNFPCSSIKAMRGLIAFEDSEKLIPLGDALYAAMWAEDRDITDPDVLGDCAEAAGIDRKDFFARIETSEVKQKVFDISKELKARGAFGAPSFFVGEKLFWGQDRLHFVRAELQENNIPR